MAFVRLSWSFQTISYTGEISSVKCSVIQGDGTERIADWLEAMWQSVHCSQQGQNDCLPKNESSVHVSYK